MHSFVKLFAIISLTCLVSSNFGFVLKPNASKGKPLSLRDLNITEGAYYIQSVQSGLVIAAFENGIPDGGFAYTGPSRSESLEEANGNKTIESMLVWQLKEEIREDKENFFSFKTLGPNHNNDFETSHFHISEVVIHMLCKYQFWDRGSGTFAMSVAVFETVMSYCVTDSGLHNHVIIRDIDCDETNPAQQWRLVKAEDWN